MDSRDLEPSTKMGYASDFGGEADVFGSDEALSCLRVGDREKMSLRVVRNRDPQVGHVRPKSADFALDLAKLV